MRRATQGRQAGRVGPKGPAVRLALLGLGLVLLGGLVGPPAATLAQQGEGRPDIGERRGRRLTLRSKENPALVAALAEAVKDVPAGVGTLVRVDGAGEPEKLALATVVAPGEAVTKASELRGRYELILGPPAAAGARRVPVTLAGVVPQHDLALLRFDAGAERPVTLVDDDVAEVGDFLISTGPTPGRVFYGVRGVGPLVVPQTTAFLGIAMTPHPRGVGIGQVTPASAADKAGLMSGDVMTAIDGQPVASMAGVRGILAVREVGDVVGVRYLRDGRAATARVRLGSRPQGGTRSIEQNQFGSDLSARASGFAEVVQHDAVLEPSDVGGPVVTLDGEVVGINIARAGRVETYALPTKVIESVLDDLRAGRYQPATRPAMEPGDGPMPQPGLREAAGGGG